MIMEWIPYAFTAISSGGIVGLINVILNRRKQAAEANDVEIKSSVIINMEWQKIYMELRSAFDVFKSETETRSNRRDEDFQQMKKELERVSKELENCKTGIKLNTEEIKHENKN